MNKFNVVVSVFLLFLVVTLGYQITIQGIKEAKAVPGNLNFGGGPNITPAFTRDNATMTTTFNDSLLFPGTSKIDRTTGNVGIGTQGATSYKFQVSGDIYAVGGWLRTNGSQGWYSQDFGGGWYMSDSTWIRGYNGKSLWMAGGLIGGDGGLTIGYGSVSPVAGGAVIAGNVGIGTTATTQKLTISGNTTLTGSIYAAGNVNTQGRGGTDVYNLNTGSIGAWTSMYSYGPICTGNYSGACNSSGGVGIYPGGATGTPATGIVGSGTSWFAGAVQSPNFIHTGTPTYDISTVQAGYFYVTAAHSVVKVTSNDAGSCITFFHGLSGGSEGQLVRIFTAPGSACGGAQGLTTIIINEGGNASAGDRFTTGSGGNLTLYGFSSIDVLYNGSRWQVLDGYNKSLSGVLWGNAQNVTSLAGTWDGTNYFRSNKGASSYLGSNNTYGVEAYSSDGGAAAMSFHRGGYYAINMGLDPDNVFRIGGWSASANRLQLDMSGNLTAAGVVSAYPQWQNNAGTGETPSPWFIRGLRRNSGSYLELSTSGQLYAISMALSTQKAKMNIDNLEVDTSKIYQLRPVSYNFKGEPEGKRKSFGLVAEEVAALFPNMVSYDDKNEPLSVDYQYLSVLLLNEMKKEKPVMDELKAKVANQEKRIQQLEESLKKLEEKLK